MEALERPLCPKCRRTLLHTEIWDGSNDYYLWFCAELGHKYQQRFSVCEDSIMRLGGYTSWERLEWDNPPKNQDAG